MPEDTVGKLYSRFTATDAKISVRDREIYIDELANIKWNIRRVSLEGFSNYLAGMVTRKYSKNIIDTLTSEGFIITQVNQLSNGHSAIYISWK